MGIYINGYLIVWAPPPMMVVYILNWDGSAILDSLIPISTTRFNFNTLMNNGFAITMKRSDAHILNWNGHYLLVYLGLLLQSLMMELDCLLGRETPYMED